MLIKNLVGSTIRPLEMEGVKMEYQTHKFKIIRRASQYNKYIKWFAETFYEDGSVLSSFGYRTEREARESIIPKENPFPIGNRKIFIRMQEITA